MALVDSVEKEFHAHFLTNNASAKLVVFVVLGFGGLVAHGAFFPDSFFEFILLFLEISLDFMEGLEWGFFALGDDLFDCLFGVGLCVFEWLLGLLFGHDDFGGFAFEDFFYFGFGEEHLHSSLVDFVLVVASLVVKFDCFLSKEKGTE